MNRAELFATVASYAHRADAAPMLPTFLMLSEQRIYFGESNSPALRIAAMRKCVVLTSPERPDDYLESKVIHELDCPSRPLAFCALERLPYAVRSYSWDGGCLALSPDQDLPVTLHYWSRFAPLAADADTNWLLTNAPNVYLTSMLTELARWSRDDALGTREAANYASAVNSLHMADKTAAYSGALPTQRMPR